MSIEAEIIRLVAGQTGHPEEGITLQTTLFGDLGVDGDDGRELMAVFTKRFAVDMRQYRHNRHFGPEGFLPWTPLYWLLLAWRSHSEKGSTPESRARLLPITIQNLVDSAQAQKWVVSY
jgi:hypothetical protein